MNSIIVKSARALRHGAVLVALATLAACSGGAPTEDRPVTQAPPVADYTGPAPATADVQAFRINVWENLKSSSRCGSCHTAGGQAPHFVRTDDVNLAYQEAVQWVNLAQPEQSRLVTKVGEGHNCWLSQNSACADTMTVWVRNWAGSVSSGGKQIALKAPPIKDVGSSKTFPDDPALFSSTVYPLLRQHCARCHASNAATPQAPYFSDANVAAAYAAARPKINLDSVELSRLVVRLRQEFHNCWNNDCAGSANQMQAAIRSFADGIPLTEVDPSLVLSKALTLYDGTVAAGGNRFESNVIALWEFKTGMGTVAFDTSGVEPSVNLNFSGDVTWMGGWGINVGAGGKAQASTASSKKLADMIKATGEYTIEAWAAPGNVVQEDAYIVSYSGGTMARNMTLAQREYQYQALTRSSTTDSNGGPALSTAAADRDAQASLQHVVVTYDPVNGRRIYVNGNYTGDTDRAGGGSLADWDDSFALVLGNETSGNRPWTGVLRLVAIHNRALTNAQIQQNFAAGVGERYFMLFNVSELVDLPQSYIMFEASQYDSYSYLFDKPTFINLDPAARPSNIPIRGMRLGVNGTEVRVGQAYVPLDRAVTESNYTPADGQRLSDVGTVIALEKGPESDLFFLSFERIGERTHARVEPAPAAPAPPVDATEIAADIGLRTFEEIYATMSAVTTVPMTHPDVRATYELVRQAMPVKEVVEGFVASQQTGVAQLAIEYCNALVEDAGLRAAYFPGFNFSASASTAFGTPAARDQAFNPLLDRILGVNVGTQPSRAQARAELDALAQRLTSCGAGCAADRTRTVVKASCAAVLGSAATLLQ
ncbi:MAG: LamG domain-containing protein [Steroidobacteraceae bacterium]|nr:LamG domain-containing protein [Nevskiaceae bacterium]MCP5359658.1 LamG domain-containing protein [Nevskiaceae bacterium]MCP5472548.1 LamG domain-containing protein [Nevskiaceae bacterium]